MINKRILIQLINLLVIAEILCGCSMKNSGLYQVSLEEGVSPASAEDENGDINNPDPDTAYGNAAEENQPETAGTIFVHVCGEVSNPGVYELEDGCRVIDAVEAAGGFTENAYKDYVNLAGFLTDGAKILIPGLDEAENLVNSSEFVDSANKTDTTSDFGNAGGLVDINRATASQLCSISGIGETKAEAIVAYREQNGYFGSTEEIMNVTGIGEGTYSKIKDKITVGK